MEYPKKLIEVALPLDDINAACSDVGADRSINHIIDLYNKIIYIDINILGNILNESIASANFIILFIILFFVFHFYNML